MLIEVQTVHGLRKVRVSDYCRAASAMSKGKIRLCCYGCDRDDHDGITPKQLRECGWSDVVEVQSHKRAVEVHNCMISEPLEWSVFDWYTHQGYCPECQEKPEGKLF